MPAAEGRGFWLSFWAGAAAVAIVLSAVLVGVGIATGNYVLFLLAVFGFVTGAVSLYANLNTNE